MKLQQQELDGAKQLRKANEGSESKWTEAERIEKQQASFVESSISRKTKQKSQKEKKFLEFEASFADQQQPFRNESTRGNFKRGGRKGNPTSGRKPTTKASKPSEKPVVDDKNFPSL